MDAELHDGTEVYSAFLDRDLAEILMRGSDSPLRAWRRQHPGADPSKATVQEIAEAWDSRPHGE
jgi:hypothetical protein